MYYDSARGLCFTTDSAGDWYIAFQAQGLIRYKLHEMDRKVMISASYPDLVLHSFSPFKGIIVEAAFLVLTSRTALHDVVLRNDGPTEVTLTCASFLYNPTRRFKSVQRDRAQNALTFEHTEPPDRWTLEHAIPHVEKVQNVFLSSHKSDDLLAFPDLDLKRIFADRGLSADLDSAKVVAVRKTITLMPGASERLRFVRSVAPVDTNAARLSFEARQALDENIGHHLRRNERLFNAIPRVLFTNYEHELLYWNAFTLLRQCMLPPEGKCSFNYYVFSREPQWGWGHGGQVFHESLAMLAYVLMDPTSAMNSQRVFIERQQPDGYINYRTGPYLDETIAYDNQLTTSAPWFCWENWELYRHTQDKQFLAEAYRAGVRFYEYWLKNRDVDRDGLCEWGGHAVLESVRDGKVAVWDEVGWPSNFEALDLNCMLVKEAKSLAQMAQALGRSEDVARWRNESRRREERINRYMWDPQSQFYYHVNVKDHSFTHQKHNDLKRREIIGFLPLWAGVAHPSQAAALVKALTDTSMFWRKYGIPTLAADDAYYDPQGYWNGPVWVQWQYLIFRGLMDYGYRREAELLAEKVAAAMIAQLKTNHSFWELYSPDAAWGGWHREYIWDGLVARMMYDLSYQR